MWSLMVRENWQLISRYKKAGDDDDKSYKFTVSQALSMSL